jgi:hypothetical protein
LSVIQSTKSFWIITTFHINRDYIAENLCVNRFDKIPTCKGQCYLNNQLEKEHKESKKQNNIFEKDFVFITPKSVDFVVAIKTQMGKNEISKFYTPIKFSSYIDCIENPPELV